MNRRINIAIDGPAASGKSTTARLLAERLHYIYIDTGAMYRAATLAVLNADGDPESETQSVRVIRDAEISIRAYNNDQRTLLNGQDVSDDLRTPEIDKAISAISSYREVRTLMVSKQQDLAKDGGVVMDGRDIGSVVLPDAELKVFLVASLETRAERRLKDLRRKGIDASLDEVREDIRRRDRIDSSRSQSPLIRAEDARELDTTNLTIEQQVNIIFQWACELI